ncbi:brevican core protein-like isoform X1 [Acropora muricata]|uniref:brevican core protein-like isoform X1 n=1 Tax=Acropora muricata TaxID=159855 RepID=UPI0034E53E19
MGPLLPVYVALSALNFQFVTACQDGKCRQLSFPAAYMFGNKCLMKHVIATVKVSDFDFCELQCYHQPNCVSVNFKVIQDSGGLHECELNNATHRSHGNELLNRHGYVYKGAENACDQAVCENGGICQSGFTDKGYRCVCPQQFFSAHCEKGCPKHWPVIGNSCYYMTGETSSTLNDAQNKCKQMSAMLPIIKSKAENTFIHGLMRTQNVAWVWLGMEREQGKMVWSDNTPAESSDGAPYNAWRASEPSRQANEKCAYLDFSDRSWNDNKCDHTPGSGPSVLCQGERKKD